MAKSKCRKKAVEKKKQFTRVAMAMLDKTYLDNLEKLLSLPKEEMKALVED